MQNTAIICRITISGIPIIKLLCRVLWRISRIVRYIPAPPPKKVSAQSVLSRTRHLPRLARLLSAIHTITEIKFIITSHTASIFLYCSKKYHRNIFYQHYTAFSSCFLSLHIIRFSSLDIYDWEIPSASATSFWVYSS